MPEKVLITDIQRFSVNDGPGFRTNVYLKGCMNGPRLQFSWSKDGRSWQEIGPALESWKISDGYSIGAFTGGFWAIGCQDMSGELAPAYFDYFDYREF